MIVINFLFPQRWFWDSRACNYIFQGSTLQTNGEVFVLVDAPLKFQGVPIRISFQAWMDLRLPRYNISGCSTGRRSDRRTSMPFRSWALHEEVTWRRQIQRGLQCFLWCRVCLFGWLVGWVWFGWVGSGGVWFGLVCWLLWFGLVWFVCLLVGSWLVN